MKYNIKHKYPKNRAMRRTKKEIQAIKAAGPPLCACGECGLHTKWSRTHYNKYIYGHAWINKKHTEQTKQI